MNGEHPLDKKFREEELQANRAAAFAQAQALMAEERRAHRREWPHAEQRLKDEIDVANATLHKHGRLQRYSYHAEPQAWEDMFRSHVQVHDSNTAATAFFDIRVPHEQRVIVSFRATGRQETFAVEHGSAAIWRELLAELHKYLD